MRTLHLVLKHKWYDKIASGEKTSEYRACSPYWNKRLFKYVSVFWNQKFTVVFHKGYTAETMKFEIKSIGFTTEKNDLNLPKCWEIKLGQRIK